MTHEQKAEVQGGMGPRPADPDPVLPLDGLLQPRGRRARSWLAADSPAFIGPTGWPNFLPTAISGASNGVLHGDFGYSITSGEKVSDRIARAALPTFILAGTALVVWIVDRDRARRVRGDQPLLAVRQRRDGVLVRRVRDARRSGWASC